MKYITTIVKPLSIALALAVTGTPALAQGMSGKMESGRTTGPGYEVTAEMQRYREMAPLMRDMSQQMNKMQDEMGKGGMSSEQQKRMQMQLRDMSDMMKQMSGLADRPSMNDPETRKQVGEMRKKMDRMMR